jgi:hypothetical protein
MDRRDFLRGAALSAAALLLSRGALRAGEPAPGAAAETDRERLARWVASLRREGVSAPGRALGPAVGRAAQQALGAPYQAGTLDAYLREGGSPAAEPLALHLDRFDCVTLVESSLAVARTAAARGEHGWDAFAREVERMRYRGGERNGYTSRLHYFSEWIADGARRGLVRDLGAELGGEEDTRPLRFMTGHRASYPALADDATFAAIGRMERSLDGAPRRVIPTARIATVQDRLRTGDVLAFATSIEGLDATHTGLVFRDRAGVARVLHAPLSGGAVEVSRRTLPEYVAAIRSSTGIMVSRPLPA